jgi:hypothetical protein
MRLPEIADRLRELALDHGLPELDELAGEIRRRPVRNRAPVSSNRMTPTLRAAIRAMKSANPTMAQVAIARHFNVNPGRVSEAIRGKRT